MTGLGSRDLFMVLFIAGGGSMSTKSILNDVVLALQLCLGLWQILSRTTVAALLKGVIKKCMETSSEDACPAYNQQPFGRDEAILQRRLETSSGTASPAYDQQPLGCDEAPLQPSFETSSGGASPAYDQRPLGRLEALKQGWEGFSEVKPGTYGRLRCLRGGVLKEAYCVGLTKATDCPILPRRISHERSQIKCDYLGKSFHLERQGTDGSMLFVDGIMSYYITDKIWDSLVEMAKMPAETVFVKDYWRIWLGLATGAVMSLEEVMDCLIVEENDVMIHFTQSKWCELLLPISLSESQVTLPKVLNLLGLVLQARNVNWLAPLVLTLIAAFLELLSSFSTSMTSFLNNYISYWISFPSELLKVACGRMFGSLLHLRRDHIPDPLKMGVYYSLGYSVDDGKSIDKKLGFEEQDIFAVIGGGAKARKREDATSVRWLRISSDETQKAFRCGPIVIDSIFHPAGNKCCIYFTTSTVARKEFDVDCDWDEFIRLSTFLDCMEKTQLGSLKSYEPEPTFLEFCESMSEPIELQLLYNMVHAREFRASIMCYIKNGYPPVYQLKFAKAIARY